MEEIEEQYANDIGPFVTDSTPRQERDDLLTHITADLYLQNRRNYTEQSDKSDDEE